MQSNILNPFIEMQDIMDYWRAEWRKVTDHSAATSLEKLFAQSNDEIIIDDVFLRKAQATWFPDAPMEFVNEFSIENVPVEHMNNMRENNAGAKTVPHVDGEDKLTGRSSVFFNKLKIRGQKTLFGMMGHELIHVQQISFMKGESRSVVEDDALISFMEFFAYTFQQNICCESVKITSFVSEREKWKSDNCRKYSDLFPLNNILWTKNVKYMEITQKP